MFNPEIEKQPVDKIKAYQEKRLQEQLSYLNNNSPYYKKLFAENGINVSEIKTLEDLTRLPFTTKDQLQKHNREFLCVPETQVVDYITTSGTLGDPVTFAATDKDLERLAYNESISFACAGATQEDIFQLMVTMDRRFMAGLAYFLGLRKLGAGVVRVGPGNPELQFDTLKRLNPTMFVTVPSFLLKLIEYAETKGIDYKNSSVRGAVCIGEPIRNNDFSYNVLGKQITDKWDIQLYSTYASTEMGAAFSECQYGVGGHLHPELMIAEFIDDEGKPVKPGELGEIVVTTLGVEGMPLLRFNTGDICHHYIEPCECGRKTLRLGPLVGRKKQMIKYKGTTLYPPSLYDILNDIEGVENYIVEVSTNDIGTDDILIRAGVKQPTDEFKKSIKDHFRAKLRVAPSIQFEEPGVIARLQFPEMSRKPVVFFDKRNGR